MGRHHYREGDEPVPGYRLVKWLGEGGFGVVWKATAPGGMEVAMKMIDLSAKNALKEFRALKLVKRIRHANLTPIQGLWLKDNEGNLLDDAVLDSQELLNQPKPSSLKDTMLVDSDAWRSRPGELIMAMGLGDKTLSDRLEECQGAGLPGIPAEELLEYLEASAKAIDYLNSAQHNIQHCDIKPQNILTVGGVAQVCDFGLARAIQDNRATKVAVSYAYAAPESFQSKPSHATDQYSLAITYVELRTGELPFDDESAIGVMNAHLNGALNLSRLPEEEREVIRRATSVDPDARYDSALKMVRALRRAFESTNDESGPGPAPEAALLPATSIRVSSSDEIVPGYRLVRQLVRGSTEEVWEATAPGGKHVALVIRELAESAAALDLDALSLVLKLGHPHLTEMLAFWLIDHEGTVLPDEQLASVDRSRLGKLVLAGRLSGSTLMHLLGERRQRTGKGIPAAELLPLMRQVAVALDFLNVRQHQVRGRKVALLHGNVQPANLVLNGQTVRLGNFGRARTLEADVVEDSIAAAGFEMAYTPPEVFEGRITRWTDQYGLALTYVHLRAGKPAFDAASSTTRLIQLHRSGELDFRELPEREVEALRRATSLDPSKRFNTCGELIDALARASEKRPGDTVVPSGGGGGSAPPREKSKTEPIISAATEVLDLKKSSTQDTTPPDSSVIETQPLIAPPSRAPIRPTKRASIEVTSDFTAAEAGLVDSSVEPPRVEREPARDSWRSSQPAATGSRNKLFAAAGALAAVLLLGGAVAWTLLPTPEVSPVVENPNDDPRLVDLDALLKRAAGLDAADADGLGEIGAELDALQDDPAAAAALAARRREVEELEQRIAAAVPTSSPALAKFDERLDRGLGGAQPTTAALTKLLGELVELQTTLNEQAANDPELRRALDARRRGGKLTALRAQARDAARAESNPAAAIELYGLLLALDASDAESQLALARLQITAGELAAARQSLAKVAELEQISALTGKLRAEHRFLAAWLEIRDRAATPEQLTKAIAELQALFDEAALADIEVATVSRDLAALGEMPSEQLTASIDALRAAESAYRNVEAVQTSLAALLARWLPEQIVQTTELSQKWFDNCREKCALVVGKGDPNSEYLPAVRLLYAECLVEPADGRLVANAERELTAVGEVPDEFAPYAAYVRAIVSDESPNRDPQEKAADLDQLAVNLAVEQPAGLSAPHRRQRAAQLFTEAAHSLRQPSQGSSVQQIAANPFGTPETAKRAAEWLIEAQKLSDGPLPAAALVDLALAAHHGQVDPQAARTAAEAALSQLDASSDDRLAMLWVSARSQNDDAPGRAKAIEQSAAIVAGLAAADDLRPRDLIAWLPEADAQLLRDEVVAPPLAQATSIDAIEAGARPAAGRLFATLAEHDLRLAELNCGAATHIEGAAAAFARAVECESNAEYLTGQARAALALNQPAAAELADAAIAADPEYAEAYYVRAQILTRKGRAVNLPQVEKLETLGQAIDASQLAIDRAKADASPRDLQRTNYLISLANALVNRANFLSPSDPEQAKQRQADFLKAANEVGDEATSDSASPYLHLAFRVRGNAEEDIAWKLQFEEDEYFARAVDSFTSASRAGSNAAPLRDKGRAQCKWGIDRTVDPARIHDPDDAQRRWQLLSDAEHDLGQALENRNDPCDPDGLGVWDANYWLALARWKQGKYAPASEAFEQYFSQPKVAPFYYRDYVQCNVQSLQALDYALDTGDIPRQDAEVPARLDAARKCAAHLAALPAEMRADLLEKRIDASKEQLALELFVAAIEGKVERNKTKANQALEQLVAAVPDLAKAKLEDLNLLAVRAHARLMSDRDKEQNAAKSAYVVALDALAIVKMLESEITTRKVQPSRDEYVTAARAMARSFDAVRAFPVPTAYAANSPTRATDYKNLWREQAIVTFRNLADRHAHHPDGWQWRREGWALLEEKANAQVELFNNAATPAANKPAAAAVNAFIDEAVQFYRYALATCPDNVRRRIEQDGAKVRALEGRKVAQ